MNGLVRSSVRPIMYGAAVILSYLLALANGYCTAAAAAAVAAVEEAGNASVRPGTQMQRLCSLRSWGSRKADIYIGINDKRDHLSDENTW